LSSCLLLWIEELVVVASFISLRKDDVVAGYLHGSMHGVVAVPSYKFEKGLVVGD
jgi:hypothetical protein